jgi:hypothetical protein
MYEIMRFFQEVHNVLNTLIAFRLYHYLLFYGIYRAYKYYKQKRGVL